MTVHRGRPGAHDVRRGEAVGPDYPDTNYRNPWNMGIDSEYEEGEGNRSLVGPSRNAVEGAEQPLHGDYNELWEGR